MEKSKTLEVGAGQYVHLTIKLGPPGQRGTIMRSYIIPPNIRYVSWGAEGRVIGAPATDGPWELLLEVQ